MSDLGRREREAVALVGVKRLSYKDAAAVLNISVDALRSRLGRAYRKLGAEDRTQAARMLKRNKVSSSKAGEQALSLW